MLTKCANPECSESNFRYLHQGKLFVDLSGKTQLRYQWLCPECCRTLTVVLQGDKTAVIPQRKCA